MSTVWDLNRLRYTVRKITGKYDTNQLPDSTTGEPNLNSNPPVIVGIDDYINDFYLFDMPEHMRTLKLKQFFTFTTLPNVGTYLVPQTVYSLEAPFYIDNYQFAWYQNPEAFLALWPEFDFIDEDIATSSGVNSYTFTITQTPIQQGTVTIGINPNTSPATQFETFQDADTPIDLANPGAATFVDPGVLTGNLGGTGTIDYLTGLVTIDYASPVVAGENINAHYRPYVAARPRDCLFFEQRLRLRPIPDDVYTVRIMSYVQPTTALGAAQFGANTLDSPLFNEWWQLIAYGAALKIFVEDGEHEEQARYKPYFEEAKLLAQRKCIKQLASQRIPTRYADNMPGAYNSMMPPFPVY